MMVDRLIALLTHRYDYQAEVETAAEKGLTYLPKVGIGQLWLNLFDHQ
jgi:hypothetical protein